ncbi:hypothetical protein BOTBODRAFT_37785 [Botryobasidium botryosum FD-172 SS1]|uniref:Wax synthase domain-containing protein n=1 Tax=Botryobasidium botryosum (strain FD-172 SS1) TaxID=930990 RepID=A0A067LZD1_BOTB1|nr:hypothetical protein BOTBODRAFT_37785 [Botryobasidium botryosum FD-172 SS1]
MVSVASVVVRFVPSFTTPPDSQPPLLAALGILFLAIFTQTYTHSVLLSYFRLVLAVPGIYFFCDHGFGDYVAPLRGHCLGYALTAIVGSMRIIDTCVVSFFHAEPPKWIHFGGEKDGQMMPMPTTLRGRLTYAFDLLMSVRGPSLFGDRRWDWTPSSVVAHMRMALPRRAYLLEHAALLAGQYLMVDALETLHTTHTWDTKLARPVTGDPTLSLPAQSMYAFAVCVETALQITIPYTLIRIAFVLLGAAPSSWPAIFTAPFSATSLADFWTNRWHTLFRRCFNRLSLLPVTFAPKSQRKFLRVSTVFALSALLHLGLVYRIPADEEHPHNPLIDTSTLKFFLSQPLGLLIESALIHPLTRTLPEPVRTTMNRMWAWGWMFWCGRWWSDVWIGRGLWEPTETLVGFSIVRGLWKGQWDVAF